MYVLTLCLLRYLCIYVFLYVFICFNPSWEIFPQNDGQLRKIIYGLTNYSTNKYLLNSGHVSRQNKVHRLKEQPQWWSWTLRELCSVEECKACT